MGDVLVGTSNGLFAVGENGSWRVKARYLEGRDIAQVARAGDAGRFLVAARGGGLTRLDLKSGTGDPLGAGVLPERVRCVAVAPSDPNTIFVGTEPVGIFVSRDGARLQDS
jgi:hypothetical protein